VRCPFLREEQVKSCQAAPFRKSLARSAATGQGERCTSADHASCPVAPRAREAHPDASRCPFLRESLVQFCAASPRPTYVPWSESPDLRCAHDGHRFCELFLAAAGAAARGPALPCPDHPEESETAVVDGVPVPGWLAFSDNHLWLDEGDDGLCHVGVDAFLARMVGSVERLTFLTVRGEVRPAVVLTVRGVDLTLVFPRALPLVAANTRLRSSLDRLTGDPYGLGWLFTARWNEGRRARPEPPLDAGLRRGRAAREWMRSEVHRLNAVVHDRLIPRSLGMALPADGGDVAPGFLRHLDHEDVLRLFAAFFPLPGDTRRNP
jgi:glycine cleavage system H lipoate-binding protein